MSIPPPPNLKPSRHLIKRGDERIERRDDEKVKDTNLSIGETSFILQKYLLPMHHEDPNVMRFIKNYLMCRNIRQAAHESGLTERDGRTLRGRPDIHLAIVKVTESAVFKHGYDAGELIERVNEIVDVDPGELQNEDGSFVENLKDVRPELRRAIKKFKAKNIYENDPNGMRVVVGKMVEVEFWDKMKGIELMGIEKDMFKKTTKVEHDVSKNMSSVLLESRKRAEEVAAEYTEVSVERIVGGSDESSSGE